MLGVNVKRKTNVEQQTFFFVLRYFPPLGATAHHGRKRNRLVCLESQSDPPYLRLIRRRSALVPTRVAERARNAERRQRQRQRRRQYSIDSDPAVGLLVCGGSRSGGGRTRVLSVWPGCRHEVTARPQAPANVVIVASEVPLSSAVGPARAAGGSTPLVCKPTAEDVCLHMIDLCWCARACV